MALQIGASSFDDLADVIGAAGFDDLAGDEISGDDLIAALQDVGALSIGDVLGRGRRRGGGRGRGGRGGKSIAARRLIPGVPGAPAIGLKLQPLGFNIVTFSATSGNALPASTRPQKPFKGKRLVVEIARVGATANGLVTVSSLTVGVNNQFVSTGSVSAGAFAATAFDVNMELSACTSALDITVNYVITPAPTGTDVAVVGTTLFGESVGS